MMPTLLQYGPFENINNFLMFYQTHHSLDDVPNPTIRTMDDEYQTVEEWTNAMHLHTISLQQTENKGIQLYTKCLESILTTPTASYNKQVEENQRLLNLKKLSNEIILGKSTEDTAITLATTPTWYYFSRPSNLAFHDFTKRNKPEKNL